MSGHRVALRSAALEDRPNGLEDRSLEAKK